MRLRLLPLPLLTLSNQNCYELAAGGAAHTGCFAVFAFEYQPGMDGA
jgi:hypothetical protein